MSGCWHKISEFCEVRSTSYHLQQAVSFELIRQSQNIYWAMSFIQLSNSAKNAAVTLVIKIIATNHIRNFDDGIGINEQRSEQAGFCLSILRWHLRLQLIHRCSLHL